MLNRSASLAMSTCVLKALPGKLDIKRHSPSILYLAEYMRIGVFKKLSTLDYEISIKMKQKVCERFSMSSAKPRPNKRKATTFQAASINDSGQAFICEALTHS